MNGRGRARRAESCKNPEEGKEYERRRRRRRREEDEQGGEQDAIERWEDERERERLREGEGRGGREWFGL